VDRSKKSLLEDEDDDEYENDVPGEWRPKGGCGLFAW
jgi:hypothetical protein